MPVILVIRNTSVFSIRISDFGVKMFSVCTWPRAGLELRQKYGILGASVPRVSWQKVNLTGGKTPTDIISLKNTYLHRKQPKQVTLIDVCVS